MAVTDPREPVTRLLRDLRSGPKGLSEREAARRLQVVGRNELRSSEGPRWPRDLARQLIHPLALLLWAVAVLAWIAGTRELALAIVVVVLLNAALAFFQEKQAERAVAALADYLPPMARVFRNGCTRAVPVAELVPGDVVLLDEGDRVPADARLLRDVLEIDASPLTGNRCPSNARPTLRTTPIVGWTLRYWYSVGPDAWAGPPSPSCTPQVHTPRSAASRPCRAECRRIRARWNGRYSGWHD